MLAALCTGVGDVGPKFDTYMPVRDALEVSFCSFLDQLSRKLDGRDSAKAEGSSIVDEPGEG